MFHENIVSGVMVRPALGDITNMLIRRSHSTKGKYENTNFKQLSYTYASYWIFNMFAFICTDLQMV
jgi:hypothetical protein